MLLSPATSAVAQDAVRSNGPLSDTDFYRLVACAAPPDNPCGKPFYRWNKTELSVGILTRARPFLGGKQKRADAALVRALQQLNAVDMAVTLRQSNDTPDIAIHLLDVARGQRTPPGADDVLDGLIMANAITALDATNGTITHAAIGFSRTMTIRYYESVMLEEITQALGLITDIENPYYRSRSILSQNGDNSLKALGEQDKVALIRHYPPS